MKAKVLGEDPFLEQQSSSDELAKVEESRQSCLRMLDAVLNAPRDANSKSQGIEAKVATQSRRSQSPDSPEFFPAATVLLREQAPAGSAGTDLADLKSGLIDGTAVAAFAARNHAAAMPPFRPDRTMDNGMSVHYYLREFERRMRLLQVQEVRWLARLINLVPFEDGSTAGWLEDNGQGKPWSEIKAAILAYYVSTDMYSQQVAELDATKRKPNESIRQFCSRFELSYSAAKDEVPLKHAIYLLMQRVPRQAAALYEATAMRFLSLQEATAWICKVVAPLERSNPPPAGPSQGTARAHSGAPANAPRNADRNRPNTGAGDRNKRNEEVHCNHCRKRGHSEENCWAKLGVPGASGPPAGTNSLGARPHPGQYTGRPVQQPRAPTSQRHQQAAAAMTHHAQHAPHSSAPPTQQWNWQQQYGPPPGMPEMAMQHAPPIMPMQPAFPPMMQYHAPQAGHSPMMQALPQPQLPDSFFAPHPGSPMPGGAQGLGPTFIPHLNESLVPKYAAPSSLVISLKANANGAPDGLYTQIVLNEVVFQALIDSGASVSFLAPSVVQQLGLHTFPIDGTVTLAHKDAVVARQGVYERVAVRYGRRMFAWRFEVLDLGVHVPIIIGLDLFGPLGISVSGILASPTAQDNVPDPVYSDEPPPLLEQPPDVPFYERIRSHIQQSLDRNARTANAFCNVPESLVRLDTKQHRPSWQFPRGTENGKIDAIREQVQKWLADGVITRAPVGCPWNHPLLAVQKKDDEGKKTKWRVCIDPRPLNSMLDSDNYPIPLLSDIYDAVAGAQRFTSLDLVQSYHQFLVHGPDRPKTAFCCDNIQYMFIGAPFGIKTLTSVFQRVMSNLLSDFPFARSFVDDILIFSDTDEEHLEHVKAVIDRLTAACLTINVAKSRFGYSALRSLGHLITVNGLRPDPEKFAPLKTWPRPRTGTDIQSFLGLMNYFRDFIPLFASVSAPLDRLRHVDKLDDLWTDDCQNAMNSLRALLYHAPILQFADRDLPYFVATDASAFAIGATLYQQAPGDNAPKRYLSFASRALTSSERNYAANMREMLGIVFALRRFRQHI